MLRVENRYQKLYLADLLDITQERYFDQMQASSDLKGKYTNELGSSFWIDTINGNTFVGRYSTAVGQPKPEEIFAVNGTFQAVANGVTIISWNVNWNNGTNNYYTITAWNGFAVTKGTSTTIYTNWLLNSMNPSQTNPDTGASLYDLKSSRTASDTFTKVS